MRKQTSRKNIAFISYADEDEEIAKNIKELFDKMGYHVFFAPVILKEKAGKEWIMQVINEMKDSRCIIPICTRNSLRKPWVLYELGIADACDLHRFPARVSEVSPEEVYLPGKQVQTFRLFEISDLVELFTNAVSLKDNPSNDQIEREGIRRRTKNILDRNPETENIIKLAKTRDIFIAGNVHKQTGMSKSEFQTKAKEFLTKLTTSLLEEGFSVSSCPQVESVGKVVTTQAIAWINKNNKSTDRYKIGGIYPIDRDLRKLEVDKKFKEIWQSQLLEFRKWYLKPQEWLLILGGKDGTEEEYSAAKQLNVKVFPFPCFGGAGLKLWSTHDDLRRSPCRECKKLDRNCGDKEIASLIKTLKND